MIVALRPAASPGPRARAAPSRLVLAAVLAAAALALLHVALAPAPLSYSTDAPDHIGTVRRMMAEGDAFPTDAFFRGAGPSGADPRKGLWHPVVALVAIVAHADPLVAWQALAALLAALFVLNAALFGALVSGGAGMAIAAWGLLVTYGGSLMAQYLGEAAFATKLADQLALACATAVLVDLEERTTGSRLAALGLALGAVAAHVFAALQFAVVFGALALGLLVRDRGASAPLRRLLATAGLAALACLPYLLWRAHVSYAPRNVIHLEPQGLLLLGGGARVVSIGVLWDWLGRAWVLFPLSWWAWGRAASRPAVLYLLTASLAVGAIMFCPPLVALLQPRLGYLLMRFVWLLPLPGALAFALPALVRGAARARAGARLAAVLGLAGLAFLLAPALGDAVRAFTRLDAERARERQFSVLRWRDALAWMDAHLPAGSVVLSDPATSYSIPMMTRHWVTTLVDQHSSPNDSLALDRILDARDALDPYAPYARLREVAERWGATAIALNDRFAEPPQLDYWGPSHGWYERARARLDAAPGAFHRVYDTGDFAIWTIDRAALDTLGGGGAPRPYLRPFDSHGAPEGFSTGPGMPRALAVRLEPTRAIPGERVDVAIDWHAARVMPAGSYYVSLRFDRPLPAGWSPPAFCAKPVRKLLETWRHERYRFRIDHLPMGGDYGVDLWRPEQIVHDTLGFRIPEDIAPGDYQAQVVLLRQPHYANFRLSDYFFDHDYYSGTPVGGLHIGRDER